MTTPIAAPPPSPTPIPTTDSHAGADTPTPSSQSSRGRWLQLTRWRAALAVTALVLVLVAAGLAWSRLTVAPASLAPTTPALTAHGTLEPVARASIATMNGGVVEELRVQVGQIVAAKQVIARVSLADQAELLLAPWAGTVTSIDVHLGDTLAPAAEVATIGDLSRYQVETTDVDEYLIGRLRAGQAVMMTVTALDGLRLSGFVRTVSLQPRHFATGDNYLVVIDPTGPNADLRPGMTVRIAFADQSQ